MPDGYQVKALADDRGGLQRLPVARRKPVHPRQYQAADRGWYRLASSFLGIAKQLLEEERIAFGALNAGQRDPLRRIDKCAGER
jgi:hypothetical protein